MSREPETQESRCECRDVADDGPCERCLLRSIMSRAPTRPMDPAKLAALLSESAS